MAELSAKAHDGTLTSAEQDQLDSYINDSHFIAFIQSKARGVAEENTAQTIGGLALLGTTGFTGMCRNGASLGNHQKGHQLVCEQYGLTDREISSVEEAVG